MKKILMSVMVIAIVAAVGIYATKAYFTDAETATGNTFSTGTIDISVDDQNPWTKSYTMSDMKPSQVDYVDFTIKNVGTNPVNVYKKLTNVITSGGQMSEPECQVQGGIWANGECPGGQENSSIDGVIDYDLNVELYHDTTLVWHQMLYNKNKTVAQIKDTDMFLGMIPAGAGWSMKVSQSYHMQSETGNWAQGDVMTFHITLTGEQLKGTALLLPKSGDPNWQLIYGGANGTLTYGVKDKTFKGTFTASGLAAGTSYSLIHYVDPWPGNGAGSVGLLSSGVTDGSGNLALNFDDELGANITNGKVWLVRSSDYNAGTKSMIAWNQANYLFETGLIDYYDSGL